jgi:glycosyltransferase involved in cell wall biosynthesis
LFVELMKGHLETDVIHFQEYSPLFASRHFTTLKEQGKRLFYTVHNIKPHGPTSAAGFAFNHLMRSAWSKCDGLFVHTEGLKSTLQQFMGPTRAKVYVTPHGVWSANTQEPRRQPAHQMALRHLLCFGVLRRNKGIHVLLEALRDMPDFALSIVGVPTEESYVRELQHLAQQFPSGRVNIVPGFVPANEVAPLFRQSSAVVLPYTDFSSQSGVLHDALAHEVPVVVTDVGALGESVRQMSIGTIARPKDANSLRDAIYRLHERSAYESATQALRREREQRSWSETARATVCAYQSGQARAVLVA